MIRRIALCLLGLAAGQLGVAGCTIPDVNLDGRGCPDLRCVDGYVCDAIDRRCVRFQPARFAPSNLPAEAPTFTVGTASAVIPADERWLVNTDTGEIRAASAGLDGGVERTIRAPGQGAGTSGIHFSIQTSASGEFGVFVVKSLIIFERGELIGIGTRPLVLLASAEVTVAGLLSVGADRMMGAPGPGGFAGGTPEAPGLGPGGGGSGLIMSGKGSGGGGASFGLEGGDGGPSGGATGGLAGAIARQTKFIGGSGGGGGSAGKGFPTNGGRGGHGGGALQISAAVGIFVTLSGVIDARGGGGGGGIGGVGFWGAGNGGGGGAGGAIRLEAPTVKISGRISANGGGGGGGASDAENGFAGAAGSVLGGAAPGAPNGGGGSDATDGGGKGGGAIVDASSQDTKGRAAGGGGGGGGRIWIVTTPGQAPYTGLSPSIDSIATEIDALAL